MAAPQRESMSNADKMWLDSDRPTNLMIINGVMLFDEVIDFEFAVRVFEERLVGRYKRFRQRVLDSTGPGVKWEVDPHFDIRCHVRHIALPAPGTEQTLQKLVSDLSSEALEPHRPLWRFWIIENVEGGSAVFGRLHHAIADGIALVQVLLSLTDPTPEHDRSPAAAMGERGRRSSGIFGRIRSMAMEGVHLAAKGAHFAYREGMATLEEPSRVLDNVRHIGLATLAGTAIVSKLIVIPPDTDSVFKGELGSHKRVVWSEPIPLAEVKALGRQANATINDLLVAAVAGALRRYMLEHGGATDMRAMIPVNLRDLSKPITELGNQFALVYLNLPLQTSSPVGRLAAVKAQMDVLKQSPEPLIVYEILSILGMAPGAIANLATDWFSNKASAVLTNVPGPREPIYFAGHPIKRILFWVPASGRIGLGISIISYNGEVTLGISVDEGLVAQPERIIAGFADEITLMRTAFDATQSSGETTLVRAASALDVGGPDGTGALDQPRPTANGEANGDLTDWPHGPRILPDEGSVTLGPKPVSSSADD